MRLVLVFISAGAAAQANPAAIDWLTDQTEFAQRVDHVGTWTPRDTQMIGVDSLTYSTSYSWPYFDVPAGPAEFYVLLETEQDRIAKAVLVFDTGVPVCGADVGTMPVDTGTGAFLDRTAAVALDKYAEYLWSRDQSLYDNWMADLIEEAHVFAQILELPGGVQFPAFSTGWGDGGYPVATLSDKDGQIVAVYADFMGTAHEDGEWLLPPPCALAGS